MFASVAESRIAQPQASHPQALRITTYSQQLERGIYPSSEGHLAYSTSPADKELRILRKKVNPVTWQDFQNELEGVTRIWSYWSDLLSIDLLWKFSVVNVVNIMNVHQTIWTRVLILGLYITIFQPLYPFVFGNILKIWNWIFISIHEGSFFAFFFLCYDIHLYICSDCVDIRSTIFGNSQFLCDHLKLTGGVLVV